MYYTKLQDHSAGENLNIVIIMVIIIIVITIIILIIKLFRAP